jgi:hypothetical protein
MVMMLGLSACSSTPKKTDEEKTAEKEAEKKAAEEAKRPLPICPQVAIIRDLESFEDYGTEKPDPSQLVAKAKMVSIEGDCEYKKSDKDENKQEGVDITFSLNFVAERGPRLGGLHTSFPYFIAVLDPDQNILNKEKMTMDFGFSSSSKVAEDNAPLHVFLPLPKDKRILGPNYQVLVGFQLNEDQAKVRGLDGE